MIRNYYRCAETSCSARKVIDEKEGTETIKITQKHNHPPNKKRKVDRKIVKEAKQRLSTGVRPATVHFQLVREAQKRGEDLHSGNIPSREQLKNWAAWLKRNKFPSRDSLDNITAMYGTSFCPDIHYWPTVRIILVADRGLKMFAEFGDIFFLDTTFDLIKEKLFLTTLMMRYQGWGIPIAWLISSNRTIETYEHFLSYLAKHVPQYYRFAPAACLGDFDPALRGAVEKTLPGTNYFGDFFHFLYDNIKWKMAYGSEANTNKQTLSRTLRILWASPTREHFDQNFRLFCAIWSRDPPYLRYFNDTWMRRFPSFVMG